MGLFGDFFDGVGDFLGNVGNAFVGDWFNRRSERRTFADNSALAWQMWNAQNAYNTPSAQMQRFREAGLNPNLIYGQTNTAAPIAVPSSRGTPPQFNALLNQQLRNMQMQNSSVAQQISQSKQQMELAKLSTMSNLAYQQAQIAGQQLSNQAQAALNFYAGQHGMPPQVVVAQEGGGLGAQLGREVRHNGVWNTVGRYVSDVTRGFLGRMGDFGKALQLLKHLTFR